ncbi:MAG: cysteine hydrolase family protein [Hyphomicrobiaceae bacterium]
MTVPAHPSGIDPKVVAKVVARRGRLHAFESLEPRRTALVVIDLNSAAVQGDDNCREIVPRINRMAAALRAAGGHVAWVFPAFEGGAVAEALFGTETARRFRHESCGDAGQLWRALEAEPDDVVSHKSGMSAFFPGKCDLDVRLRDAGVDTVLVAGTVTNVCCASSAGDACELGYRVTMVSDACAGHAQGLHEAALASFYRSFGDVRPVADVMALIRGRAAGL